MSHYEKTERAMKTKKSNGMFVVDETIEDVQKFELCDGIPERNLTKATCHHFEMREERDGVGMPVAHYLPVTYRGSVTGYIKRTVNLPKSRAWSVVGTVTDDCELLGTAQSKQDGTRTLLVVEGMYDLLAAYQMVMQHTERQYKGNINVVSLVLGTKNAVRNCVHNEEFINKHKNILLCFDNDMVSSEEKKKDPSMMRGKEATQAVGIRFKNAERIPLTLNDPCEYSKANKSKEFYNLVAFNKTPIEFAFINRGVKISVEELLKESEPGIETGVFPKLDRLLGGFRKNEFTILLGPAKAGKELPLTETLITPTGTTLMGDIEVGDKVVGQDGLPTKVTGVFPQGVKPLYTIKFSDNTTIEAGLDHQWATQTRSDRSSGRRECWTTLTTKEMMARLEGTSTRTYIPMCEPVQWSPADLPIHPYALGALIGDGSFRNMVTFINQEQDIVSKLNSLLSPSWRLTARQDPITYGVTARENKGSIRNELKKLGLDYKLSYEKSIPELYKYSSVDQRLQLVQGLMDTDGSIALSTKITKGSAIEYSTASEQLARDVKWLVESLGGCCKISSRMGRYTKNGEVHLTRTNYRLRVGTPKGMCFFTSKKHLTKWEQDKTTAKRFFKSIEFSRYAEAQCISVAAEDQLYLAGDFVVTHNTTVAREIAYSFLKNTDEVVCYASLEDTRSQLASSFVALDHSVAPSEFMLDKTLISQSQVQSTLDTVLSEERFVLIDSESGDISPKEIVVLLRKAIDMGATLFIYDHLSFSVDSGAAKGNKKDIIDTLLTEMSNLVKEHPIHILGIAHITHEKGRGEVRDRDTGETKYPYFYSVGRMDGAGSSGYAKLCDNLLLIDQQFIGNEEIGLRRLKLALNRRTKNTGIADYFSMNDQGRVYCVDPEY